jgi:flavorubredoxin
LKEMKTEVAAEPIRIQHVPRDNDLARCYALGEEIALQLRKDKEVA